MSLLADIDSLPRHPATPVLTPLENTQKRAATCNPEQGLPGHERLRGAKHPNRRARASVTSPTAISW
jgi:hypothetical protein